MKKSFLSIVLVSLVVAACSSTTDTDPATTDANVTAVSVGGSAGNQFSPPEVTIKVGQKVRWTFGAGSHNVVSGGDCAAPEPAKFTSGDAPSTGTFEHVFDTAGDFPYQCTNHCSMGMKGVVHVQ